MGRPARAALAAMTALVLWVSNAVACPFCTTAKTGNGYLAATLVLLVLPLAAIGGFVLWVRRCTRTSVEPTGDEAGGPPL